MPPRPRPRPLTAAIAFTVVLAALPFAAALASHERVAFAAESFAARGVIKSFGPDRKYVNIAHEKIPGYMEAMTMSFEPRAPAQLESLAVGDHVVFRFTDSERGHRLLDAIKKE